MDKAIGIYLAPAPGQAMTNQGIGRVLAHLIKGLLTRQDHKVVIALPSWAMDDFADLLADHHIDERELDFVTIKGTPVWLRIRAFTESWAKRRSRHRLSGVLRSLTEFLVKRIVWPMAMRSIFGAVAVWFGLLVLVLPIALVLAAAIFPVLIVLGLLAVAGKWGLRAIRAVVRRLLGNQVAALISGETLLAPATAFRQVFAAHRIYSFLRKHEVDLLVKRINARRDVPVWFVPALFWPEVAGINSKKVIAAPDFVSVDFPTSFREPIVRQLFETCASSALAADALICYSEHVRDRHLVGRLGIPKERISVIYNGVADLSRYLNVDDETPNPDLHRLRALEIVAEYQREELKEDPYLRDFNFSSAKYIFYSSQVRPHKNFRNLIEAYERLLRREFVNVKLVLTAKLEYAPDILKIVQGRRLHRDVISLFDVPSEVLAALNCLAECAVVPTLFEGGFPSFSFSEAYSVGTPCLMSSIPVTLEREIDSDIRRVMLFDPLDVSDMVRKFRFGIESRSELFEIQRPVWDMLTRQDWDDIACQYIEVIERCAGRRLPSASG